MRQWALAKSLFDDGDHLRWRNYDGRYWIMPQIAGHKARIVIMPRKRDFIEYPISLIRERLIARRRIEEYGF